MRPPSLPARVASLVAVVAAVAACGATAAPVVPAAGVIDPGCAPPDAEPAHPGGGLPEGATSVRLCPATGSAPDVDAPTDLLTTGVEELLAVVGTAPTPAAPSGQTFCSQEGRPGLVWRFGYPDGRVLDVSWGLGSCAHLELGGTRLREDATLLDTTFSRLVLAQRESTEPTGPVGEPVCSRSSSTTTLPTTELDLAEATLCRTRVDGSLAHVSVPDDLVYRIEAELDTAPVVGATCSRDTPELTPLTIAARSSWDDAVVLFGSACGWYVVGPVTQRPVPDEYRRVPPDLVADLVALLPPEPA